MNVQEMISPILKTNAPSLFRQVKVAIGGDGQEYNSNTQHFEISNSVDTEFNLVLLLPDSVAEFYRQEGRRQLQSELRGLLNVSRA